MDYEMKHLRNFSLKLMGGHKTYSFSVWELNVETRLLALRIVEC